MKRKKRLKYLINQKCLKQGEKKEPKAGDKWKRSLKDGSYKPKYISNNIKCKLHEYFNKRANIIRLDMVLYLKEAR